MEYPGLDKSARMQVWKNFLENIDNELSEDEMGLLANVELNGRQIKNVLKTSSLLARHKGSKLRYEYLQTVLDIKKRNDAPQFARAE